MTTTDDLSRATGQIEQQASDGYSRRLAVRRGPANSRVDTRAHPWTRFVATRVVLDFHGRDVLDSQGGLADFACSSRIAGIAPASYAAVDSNDDLLAGSAAFPIGASNAATSCWILTLGRCATSR
jgi:hypothetical protein